MFMSTVGAFMLCLMFTSAGAACKVGWLDHDGQCYYFSQDVESWIGAMGVCRMLDGSLAEVDSADVDNFLVDQINNIGGNYWIGLTNLSEEGSFKWMTSDTRLTSESFTNWHAGNPSNSGLNENCVHYLHALNSTRWNDLPCSHATRYICERSSDEGMQIVG